MNCVWSNIIGVIYVTRTMVAVRIVKYKEENDMDLVPPPDYAYSEYMIWISPPPPDYAYYEYMIWMMSPLHPMTTPIMNI